MDMELIAIKVDPGTALTTLDQATTKLRAAETQGQQTQGSMAGLTEAFRSFAQALQQGQSAEQRAAALHAELSAKNSALVGSFTGLAQAIQRERDTLDQIHGPARKVAAETETLNSLLAKGAIDADQYAKQLAKVKAEAGSGPSGGGGGAGGGFLKGIAGQFGLGGLGGLGAAAGAVFAAKEVISISDAWTEAENHARKFVDANHDIHQVMADQVALSKDLHMSLDATMAAFDDVGDATERLNMSYSSTITLTKALSEAATLDYKSTGQLTQELMQLSVAFETGGRVAGPLRQLFRDSPALAHLMMDNLHMTEQQIVQFAAKGELSFKDVARALALPGPALDKMTADFNARTVTAQQRWEEFKQDLEAPIDLTQAFRNFSPVDKAAQDIQHLADSMRDGTGVWRDAASAVDQYNRNLKEVIETARRDIWDEQIDLVGELQKGYGILTTAVGKYTDYTIAARKAAHDQAVEMAKLRLEYANEAQILALQRDLNPEFNGLKSIENATAKGEQAAKDLQKFAEESFKAQDEAAKKHAAELAKIPEQYAEWEAKGRDVISGLDSGWKQIVLDATDSGKHIRDAMTGAFQDIQQSLEDMVLKGKLDLSSLGSELEQLAVRFAVQQATGGLLGLIGGGMTGFDYMTPGSGGRYAFPGFATGGDMLVGGSGGPDTKTAIFRVTPGETISVRTPQQLEAARKGGSSSGPGHTIVNLNYDPHAIRSGKDIETGVMNVIRRNPAAIRALLGG
jgi:lambda family phage tail tape measure protein